MGLLLLFPAQSLLFSFRGLELWFQKMIPALFPFMVLSGMMIRLNLTDTVSMLFKPLLRPLFRVNENCIYNILIGFLCGFPMGAHVAASLYLEHKITKREAEYLLSFCNNIGPVYFMTFALPVLGISKRLPALVGMYGIPLLYGILLRRSCYKEIPTCTMYAAAKSINSKEFIPALDESVMESLNGITKLGGYMIVFNMLNILPHLFFKQPFLCGITACVLEISGGLSGVGTSYPVICLILLQFGGISCMFQTYTMIRKTDLSFSLYIKHKINLTILCTAYYLGLALISYVS